MPIDATQAGSPGWWLARLMGKLGEVRDGFDELDSYYQGTAGVPVLATKAVREAYRRLMSMARTNFAELVVEAVRERMIPTGFRTGAAGDELGDREAWRIYNANDLGSDSALVHRAKLSMGMAYVIVGGVDADIGAPLITAEDPREVYVETDPRRRRKALAGVKVFRDDVYRADRAFLYLPGRVLKAARNQTQGDVALDIAGWEWDGDDKLPAPVVPVVPFPNQANMAGVGTGEFQRHLAILNRINYSILSRLEIATLQAFRQRAVKGDLPTHDADGNEIDYDNIFANDPGALWLLPATAQMWESGQVDLGPLLQGVRHDVQDLAAVTRTPLFYLTPEAANGSAEGASLAREGLVFKAGDRIAESTAPWARVMQLSFLFAGDTVRASSPDLEVLWAPPERFSLSERADAAAKALTGGVPWRTVMTDIWQFDPTQVDRMEGERAADAFLGALGQPETVR